jgi:hypothetical protein
MKTRRRVRLFGGVVSPLILFVGLLSLPPAGKVWTTAAMFPPSEDTFEFTNDETEDAYDLHIEWSRAVEIKEVTPFKKKERSGTSRSDLSNGVVKPTGKASVTVEWDGTGETTVKEWYWTKKDGSRLGEVKKGNPATASLPATSSSTSRDGLRIVTFDTLQGRVIVNLPDDMRAGDTISGTVVAEPKGNTEQERAKNLAAMDYFYINMTTYRGQGSTMVHVESVQPFTIKLPPTITPSPPLKNVSTSNSGGLGITLTNTSGSLTTGPTQTVPIEMVSLNLQSIAPITVQLPTIAQQGRQIEVIRPFDGNSSNTSLNWTKPRTRPQDFEKNTENVSGGFGLIAESPRKAVFQSPSNVTGPMQVTLKEGTRETKGTFRNVGVNLSAPETNLRKGQKTTLTVQVIGLEGLTKPVPLTLTYGGVITMDGGNYQPLMIQPSQVGADGRYTTTRGITGMQTGGWEATATVVTRPFDFCLQDDSEPARVVLWNTFTGDYIFSCPGCPTGQQGSAAGQKRTSGESGGTKTGGATQSGGTTTTAGPTGTTGSNPVFPAGLSGAGTVVRKGCIITLTHNAPDRRVFARLDPCTSSGTTTIETPPTRMKFTITDRNTTDNTCSMH